MHHPFSRLSTGRVGRCCLLLACAGTAVHAASGNLEIDLLFPQNDTYAPQPIIPVVFAIQNSALAGFLRPSVNFVIYPYLNHTVSSAYGYFNLVSANFSESDPYMVYGEGLEVLNTEGVWTLEWSVHVTSCFISNGDLDYRQNATRQQVTFTTKNSAKMPDLTAATGPNTCSKAHSHTFKITETQDSGDTFDNGKPCAILAETMPVPSPCAVKIDSAAAASVSARMTNRACAVANATWCPEPTEDGVGRGLVVPSLAVGVAFLAAAFGGGMGFILI
ncbi:hypothetical protein V495_01946 [Pseudogymnoascus sp. VKM F-4514 (FW-929)]|nr:hypothetical protein V495_01946 [Pseudogymnoascus sp. VKM F-4514 (FW-929)]KFY66687.1 hypothetical protein V497_00802 [Pseudogymnoascus sp. VKM F-4516 (FW-969)]